MSMRIYSTERRQIVFVTMTESGRFKTESLFSLLDDLCERLVPSEERRQARLNPERLVIVFLPPHSPFLNLQKVCEQQPDNKMFLLDC